jgi:carbon-monoxide dehydrogenase medium subunit
MLIASDIGADMWQKYFQPISIDEALEILAEYKERARIVAGGTDLILEMEAGLRKDVQALIDVTRIPGLDQISLDENNVIHLGPMVTHNHVVASKLLREQAIPLAEACWLVGAPQIRNRGTVAGNLITGSPANDTISPLMAMNASVTLQSKKARRTVPMAEFFKGVRKTVLAADEMLVDIQFPALDPKVQRGTFYKSGLRRAQAISVVNLSAILAYEGTSIKEASITLGSVAPTIVHADEAEAFLVGKTLDENTIEQTAEMVEKAASPIDDLRGSADYRSYMVGICARRALRTLADNKQGQQLSEEPVLLWGGKELTHSVLESPAHFEGKSPIKTTSNGKAVTFKDGHEKTLLRLLREDGLMTGTKEGCAEGECGACTVFLDGVAVMSCLVPAPRAHGAQIVTIEGLSDNGNLHPVQQSFVDAAAVQCGYCTPGFIMSAAKLLEEKPHPSHEEIQQAISGNICRCTGYYKIIDAIEKAAE